MAPHDPQRPGFCIWLDLTAGTVECQFCHAIRPRPTMRRCGEANGTNPAPKLRPVRECRTCVHLGPLLRIDKAICCGGVAKGFKVFSCRCAAIGECQLGVTLKTVPSCRRCNLFFPPASDLQPSADETP